MAISSLKRILMAEDDQDIRLIAQMALEAMGSYTVRMCSCGAEALEAAPGFQPNLIILDVMMPNGDGPSTLQALRALPQFAKTPIVFLTARAQPSDLVEYEALGVFHVIPKPFDPIQLSATIEEIWKRHLAVALEAEMRALTAEYVASLPETLLQIEQVWATAQESGAGADFKHLHRLAHTVLGTGATLHLHDLSEAARQLEAAVAPLRERALASDAERAEVAALLVALNRAAAAIAQSAGVDQPAGPEPQQPAWSLLRPAGRVGAPTSQVIALAEVPPGLALDLSTQLGYFGYIVHTTALLDRLHDEIERLAPVALVTDAAALERGTTRDERLLELRRKCSTPPAIIVLSDHGDLDTRLRAVRAGADAFFTQPVNTSALIDKLDQVMAQHAAEPNRILIVEDQCELANSYAAVLQAAGMLTVVVNDPLQVMQPLVEFRPDLILLDMYMPNCDGMTLAAVIRQQEDFVGIPIVFLSAETNRDMQLAAMQLGADDFLSKPIIPDYLMSAVSNRVQRARSLRSLMIRDSLTGLFNHTATKERLEAEIIRAHRDRKPLSFALLDIDLFKQVNDTYGHPTGDWVLKSLARLLQQRLRRTDIIGRYGGEEFAVVLPGTEGPVAAKVLDEIRAGLAHIHHHAEDRDFTVTFSCGVASFPDYAEAAWLTNAADKALYAAKHGGRNRVILAGRQS
jgi:diguanylate cyclase (GGDEF)-like protein